MEPRYSLLLVWIGCSEDLFKISLETEYPPEDEQATQPSQKDDLFMVQGEGGTLLF